MSGVRSLLSHPLVYDVGWTLVHFVWQGTVVAFALAAALLLLRKRTANARYAASCAALLLMGCLPVATFYSMRAAPVNGSVTEAAAVLPAAPIPETAPVSVGHGPDPLQRTEVLETKVRIRGLIEAALPWLALAWILGVIGQSLRVLGGWIHLERLRHRHARLMGSAWRDVLDRLASRLGVRGPVEFLESTLIQAPVVFGWFRPVILMPVAVLVGLTNEQVEAVIAHELAHIRRQDYLVRLLQTFVETTLFYHPAVWWVSHQMTVEREYCCDDLAAKACGNAVHYARALTELAQTRWPATQGALAATDGSLLERVRRLLVAAPRESLARTTWWPGSILAMAAAVTLMVTIHLSASAAGDAPAVQEAPASTANAQPVQNNPIAPAVATPAASTELQPAAPKEIGIALLEFGRVGSQASLGETSAQMYELVLERLANAPGLRLVDREKLAKTMQELHLGQSGLVDPASAMRVGQIVGARFFAVGKIMKLGSRWVVTARLIDTETTQISAIRVTSEESEGVLALADLSADKLIERLNILARGLPASSVDSPLAREIVDLRKQLAGRDLPVVLVSVPELHIGTWVPDPAGENEIINVLSQVGFRVVDVSTLMKKQPAQWWVGLLSGTQEDGEGTAARLTGGFRSAVDLLHDKRIEKIVEKVDVYVVGEAFSEYAGDIHGFKSCTARIEVKAIDTKTETIAVASSQHAVAADISELTAGKKALRSAGSRLGLVIAKQVAEYWERTEQAAAVRSAEVR